MTMSMKCAFCSADTLGKGIVSKSMVEIICGEHNGTETMYPMCVDCRESNYDLRNLTEIIEKEKASND